MTHKTIALVDDDRNILTSVSMALEQEGFAVSAYCAGQDALRDLDRTPADLVVLDIKMPGLDGIEVLKRLRADSTVPVIMLTSKDQEVDQLVGLHLGADDYMTKPFSLSVLIGRIRALLRRQELAKGGADSESSSRIKFGDLVLDGARHLCTWKSRAVRLTVTEFLVLKCLSLRPGHVKSRQQIMDAAYAPNVYVSDRTIDTHIKRIRRKFEELDPEFDQIETLYGLGYCYRDRRQS